MTKKLIDFKVPAGTIPDENPFKYDALERTPAIESLTQFITRINSPFVFAINAPWGSGKTVFLQLWQAFLKKSGHQCIYLDAWKMDFATDPLIGFLDELNAVPETNEKFKKAMQTTKKIATALAKRAIPALGKILTAGALDIDKVVEDVVAEFVENELKDLVDVYSAEKTLIQKFKKSLSEVVSELRSVDKSKNLIIFVDELDRCRPSFSIEVLERIKHLFDIEGAVFVLGIDKEHLAGSLKCVYGNSLNSDEYLRRFIDMEFLLPEPSSTQYSNHLFERFSLAELFSKRTGQLQYDWQGFQKVFDALADFLRLNLRAREQCLALLKSALLVTKDNEYIFPNLLASLIVFKVHASAQYREFVLGEGEAGILLSFLSARPGGDKFLASYPGIVIESYLLGSKPTIEKNQRAIEAHRVKMNDGNEKSEVRSRSQHIVQTVNNMERDFNGFPILTYVIQKIELAARFKT